MREWPWYGYLFIAVIIFGFFFLLYFNPKNKELEKTRNERIKVEDDVSRLRVKRQQLDRIEAEIANLNKTLRELEAIVPLKEEISEILRKIQQLAFDSRINITKFTPDKEIDKEFYYEQPYSIEMTGNYHNLAIFFDRLSRFSRLFNIDDFSIKTVRRQTDASTIRAASTAKTYIFYEKPPLPKEKTKKPRKKKK